MDSDTKLLYSMSLLLFNLIYHSSCCTGDWLYPPVNHDFFNYLISHNILCKLVMFAYLIFLRRAQQLIPSILSCWTQIRNSTNPLEICIILIYLMFHYVTYELIIMALRVNTGIYRFCVLVSKSSMLRAISHLY